jgi:alpha-tubulin suppressor-like RCC1 family protein
VVRCWGRNNDGQLGIGGTQNIGDDEIPGSIAVLAAPAIVEVAAGGDHSCGITADFELVCWGRSNRGQLGYGNKDSIGNDPGESPNSVGVLDLYPATLPNNATLADVSLGKEHSCARFSGGQVICWGRNDHGQLGRSETADWGDGGGESPAMLEPISLGGVATAISAGFHHTCALLEGGSVRCWGLHDKGQLGLGDIGDTEVGDDEVPTDVPLVDLGGPAIAISAGWDHTCALLATHEVLCWGENTDGRLGYGHTDRIGDDETPASAGPLDVL